MILVFVLCEMQSVLSRIWTRTTVSISYDDKHYTTYIRWYDLLLMYMIVCKQMTDV